MSGGVSQARASSGNAPSSQSGLSTVAEAGREGGGGGAGGIEMRNQGLEGEDGGCLTFRERAEVMIQNNLPKGAGGAGKLWSVI